MRENRMMLNEIEEGEKYTVSVVLSVYRAEQYKYTEFFKESIESLFQQTFQNFEIIVVIEYGCYEEIISVAEELKKKNAKLKLVYNKKRLGFAESLNKGIQIARGKYIARMDDDDISMPDRLEKQVKLLEMNPEIGICGTGIVFREKGKDDTIYLYPNESEEIKCRMIFSCSLAHPSVMFRKDLFIKNKWYYDPNVFCEDFELWSRILKKIRIANIPEALVVYRFQFQNTSIKSGGKNLYNSSFWIIKRNLKKYFDIKISEKLLSAIYPGKHMNINENYDFYKFKEELLQIEKLLKLLIEKNEEKKFADSVVFKKIVVGYIKDYLNLPESIEINEDGQLIDLFKIPTDSRIIIRGLGKDFHDLLKKFPLCKIRKTYNLLALCDKKIDLKKSKWENINYIYPEKIKNYDYDYIIIASNLYFQNIKKELEENMDIVKDKIVHYTKLYHGLLEQE